MPTKKHSISSRNTRKRRAKRRKQFGLVSFGLGIVVTLIAIILLSNGRNDTSIPTSNAAAPEETIIAAMLESTPVPTPTPFRTPEPTPTPIPVTTYTPAPTPTRISRIIPSSITLDVDDKIIMQKDDVIYIVAQFHPEGAKSSLTWKTSDEKVVKVNEEGGIKAVGKGTAKVGVWADEGEAYAIVDIKVEEETKTTYVWIPKTGTKYHKSKKCSNMKNPSQVSLSTAKSRGYEKCSKCY